MYDTLALFRMSESMARHAGERQAVVARNMANADTPGYRAQATLPFADVYRTGADSLRANRAGHMTLEPGRGPGAATALESEPSPNGNSVSLEMEMIAAAEIEREQSKALAVYRHGLTVLRTIVAR